jgi:hypothetical protein
MNLTLPEEDQPTLPNATRFRVIVLLPAFIERLIEKLRQRFGGA